MEREKIIKIKRIIITIHNTNDKCGNSNNKSKGNKDKKVDDKNKSHKKNEKDESIKNRINNRINKERYGDDKNI